MPDGEDLSNSMPLTDVQRAEFIARMKAAWARLPEDKRAAFRRSARVRALNSKGTIPGAFARRKA